MAGLTSDFEKEFRALLRDKLFVSKPLCKRTGMHMMKAGPILRTKKGGAVATEVCHWCGRHFLRHEEDREKLSDESLKTLKSWEEHGRAHLR